MKKSRILSLAMTGALCVSLLAGCGGGNSGSGGTAATTAPGSTPEASTPAPGGSDPAPSTAGGTFKLGGIGPLTGDAAIYGNAAMNGAKIAVEIGRAHV